LRHPVCLKAEAFSSACSDVAVVLLGMSSKRDFRQPKTRQEEEDCLAKSVPQSTRYHTKWAVKIFREWQNSRNIKYASEEEAGFHVELDTFQSLELCRVPMPGDENKSGCNRAIAFPGCVFNNCKFNF
jgi:hypothetical protein